jgi:hypothetical protein
MKPGLIGVLLSLMTSYAIGDWTPPPRPDPSAILTEARADADAGRYSDALAKHLWFHRNALTYNPALYGVRLSFALGYWRELSKKYPPALSALEDSREETAGKIRSGAGSRDDFHDFSSINEYLNEEAATTELFVWLDKNNPAFARTAYASAERALIESKNYQLCGKYIEPSRSTRRMVQLYHEHRQMVKENRFGADMLDFAQKSFSNEASTLVALLVLNGRNVEADEVVVAVLKERADEGFRRELEEARKGIVPEPWLKRGK